MNRRNLVSLLLLSSLSLPVLAADLLQTVQQRGQLNIAVEGTYPPFNFRNRQQQLTGFEVELGQELARRLGVKAHFTTGEWSALLAGLQAGKSDIVLNQVAVTEARHKVFDFSQPYTISSAQLIVRQDDKRTMDSVAALKGKTIGVAQGSNYAELAKSLPGVTVKTYPGAPEYLQDLATGRIDAALNDSLLIPFAIKTARLPLKPGLPLGGLSHMAIPFAKGNPAFQAAIDKALTGMQKDGSFARLSTRWFGQDVSRAPVGTH
ncbi:MAG: transporter substrate-binding domain-containing protein [Laribacter sp.]|nr:transporter substrate-binding domain-containing protein [Laribacter sp.]MBP9527278.1 transporter substrate-binding domain-containing protein [Laribacter sp.]MBP9608063.1 transporter substrate-binding domain-containing protein [Laribacter sp.]